MVSKFSEVAIIKQKRSGVWVRPPAVGPAQTTSHSCWPWMTTSPQTALHNYSFAFLEQALIRLRVGLLSVEFDLGKHQKRHFFTDFWYCRNIELFCLEKVKVTDNAHKSSNFWRRRHNAHCTEVQWALRSISYLSIAYGFAPPPHLPLTQFPLIHVLIIQFAVISHHWSFGICQYQYSLYEYLICLISCWEVV